MPHQPLPDRIILAITGASGAIYGIRTLEILKDLNYETHLIISTTARLTIQAETDYEIDRVHHLAKVVYDPQNLSAAIASGSFTTRGMIVAPCSVNALRHRQFLYLRSNRTQCRRLLERRSTVVDDGARDPPTPWAFGFDVEVSRNGSHSISASSGVLSPSENCR